MSSYDLEVWAREFIDAHQWIGVLFLIAGILAWSEAYHQARARMKP